MNVSSTNSPPAAKADPIAFRLKYLDPADARGIETLNRVAALAKWDTRASPKSDRSGDVLVGRGVAYCKYELVRTYVAAVAEVEVTVATGAIRVTKFFIAHDCGQIINPDGLKNQIDGNIIQTISRTLKEEVKFDRSMVTSLDWESYPILTFPEIPEIAYRSDRSTDRAAMGRRRTVRRRGSVRRSRTRSSMRPACGCVRFPSCPDKVKEALRAA